MLEKKCRLATASKFYGGGGTGQGGGIGSPYGSSGGNRFWLSEQPSIQSGYNFQQRALEQYINQNPLARTAQQGALDFWGQLPGMQQQLQGYNRDLGQQRTTLSSWLNAPGGAAATIAGGGYSPYMGRMGSQGAARFGALSGTLRDPAAAVRDYQGREDVRKANYAQALQQGQGLLGQQQGLIGAQGANVGQQQGLQTGALNQLTGVQGAAVSQAGQRQNPILGYLGNLFSGNQQTQVAGAQIAAQSSAASDAKTASIINAAMSSIGQAVGGISDERLKQKIKATGLKTAEGIPLKIYEFKTRPGVRFLGPMAQDVEKVRPDAVRTDEQSGVKMVDFWKIRAPMIELHALEKEVA